MAGYDQHGLGDQAETVLLHDGSCHGHRLAGADGMGKVGRAIGDDPPDTALLVPIKNKGARGAGKLQMGTIEFAWRYVVETIVVVSSQAIGAIGISPDPVLKRLLDPLQLVAGSLRVDDIENPSLSVGILEHVKDLRDAAVQRIGKQIAGMAAAGAPLRCASGAVT
jgi:hypothetical protein